MRIRGAHAYVDFDVREATTLPFTDNALCFSVEVAADGFSGKDESVWFGRQEIDRFLIELRQLEAARSGSARLTDQSDGSDYDGMSLEIFTIDSAGHMALRVELSKACYIGTYLETRRVKIAFGIDSDWFLSIVGELQTLFAEQERVR